MPTDTFHILSIDFDFFQNVTPETLEHYPDGVDVSTEMSTLIWSLRYANPKKTNPLKKVTCNSKELNLLHQYLNKQVQPDAPIYIANSHVHIYDCIHHHVHPTAYENIWLSHIDMHHDCFNNNPELDCGNWISYVKQDYPKIHIQWIANPVSRQVYNITETEFDFIQTSLNTLQEQPPNLIYLCRSDNWLPPHLDDYFEQTKRLLTQLSRNVYVQSCVQTPRNYQSQTKELESVITNIYERNKNHDLSECKKTS